MKKPKTERKIEGRSNVLILRNASHPRKRERSKIPPKRPSQTEAITLRFDFWTGVRSGLCF